MPESKLTLQSHRFKTMFHFGEKLDMRQYPSLVWVGGFYAITQVANDYRPFYDGESCIQDVHVTVKRGEEILPSILCFHLYGNLTHIGMGMSLSDYNKVTDKSTLRYKQIMRIKKMLDKDLAKWKDEEIEYDDNSIRQYFKLKYNDPALGLDYVFHHDIGEFSIASLAFYRRIEHFPIEFQWEFELFKSRLHGYE